MKYENLNFDEERALYGMQDIEVINCVFAGPADGESALKDCSNIVVGDCNFRLRYPFWHVNQANIYNVTMEETCRAAFWYDKNIHVVSSKLGGIKALRECEACTLVECDIRSAEFGWKSKNISLMDCVLQSEYVFLETKQLYLKNVKMTGKYSFQYVENVIIEDSVLDTKDAFWHGKNVIVKNSIVKGEYLAWYADNIRFINCKIIGTQPFCYVKGLVLENCEMVDTDLAFEYSEVEADVNSHIVSVKNPLSGYIHAKSIGEIILDEYQRPDADCKIVVEE